MKANNTTPKKKKSAAKKAAPKQRELKTTTESRINGLDVRITAIEKLASSLNQRLNLTDASQAITDGALDAHFDKVYQKTHTLGQDITLVDDRLNRCVQYFNDELKKQKNYFSDSIKVLWLGYAAVAVVEFILLCIILS